MGLSPSLGDRGEEDLLQQVRWVQGLAFAILRDRQLAEDVSQEVLLRALAGEPRQGRVLQAWLSAVTKNLSLNARRDRRRRRAREERAARPEASPAGKTPLEVLEAHRALTSALAALTPDAREVVVLRFFEDLGFAEIAARLGIREEAARMRLHRALVSLRIQLAARDRDWKTLCTLALPTFLVSSLERPVPLGRILLMGAATARLTTLVAFLVLLIAGAAVWMRWSGDPGQVALPEAAQLDLPASSAPNSSLARAEAMLNPDGLRPSEVLNEAAALGCVARLSNGADCPVEVAVLYTPAFHESAGVTAHLAQLVDGVDPVELGTIVPGARLVIQFPRVPQGFFTAVGATGMRVRGRMTGREVVFTFPPLGRIVTLFSPTQPGQEYSIRSSTGSGVLQAHTSSSPFILENAPFGQYLIRVSSPGETGYAEFYHGSQEDVVEVFLHPSRSLRITLRDQASGVIEPTAEVRLTEWMCHSAVRESPGIYLIDNIGFDTPDYLIRARSDTHPEQEFDIRMPEGSLTHEYEALLNHGPVVRFHCTMQGVPVPGARGTLQYRYHGQSAVDRVRTVATAQAGSREDGIIAFSLPEGVLIDSAMFVSDSGMAAGTLEGKAILLDEVNRIELQACHPIRINFQDPDGPRDIRLNVLGAGNMLAVDGPYTNYFLSSADEFILELYPMPKARIRVESLEAVPLARKDIDMSTPGSITIALPPADSTVLTILDADLTPMQGILEVNAMDDGRPLQSLSLDAHGMARIQISGIAGRFVRVGLRSSGAPELLPIAAIQLGSRARTYRRILLGDGIQQLDSNTSSIGELGRFVLLPNQD